MRPLSPLAQRLIKLKRVFFANRGLDLDSCSLTVRLLGTVDEVVGQIDGVSYGALAQAFKTLLQRASVRLPLDQARRMQQGSLHWLRHTHGRRSAKCGLNEIDIQTNLGHADHREMHAGSDEAAGRADRAGFRVGVPRTMA